MIATMLLASDPHGPHGGWGGGWSGGGWWWLAWPLGWLVFLAVIGLVTWAVVRAIKSGRPSPATGDTARRILAERFARGEIGEEEYRSRLDQLS